MTITYKRVNGEWVRENRDKLVWVSVPLAVHFLMKAGAVHAGVIAETFAAGGAGFAIVQLLAIAAFSTLACFLLQALGKGQIANMVKLVAAISCIALVIGVVGTALGSLAALFHVSL